MIPNNFEYYAPATVEEAVKLVGQHGDDCKILSGGQSLLPLMKMRLSKPAFIVDIGRIPGLDGITKENNHLVIGALVTHAQIENSPLLKDKCPLLAQTATTIADVQVRNRGTLGGSVAHADPAGDWPAAVLALDAEVKITGPNGERWLKCEDFFLGLLMSVLEPDEIVTALKVPVTGQDKTAYMKAAPRSSGFAVVGVANGAGGDGHHSLGPVLLPAGLVVGDDSADPVNRVRAEVAGVLHAPAEVGDGGEALGLADLGPLDVGDQQPGRVRPDVDYGNAHHARRALLFSPLTGQHSIAGLRVREPQLSGPRHAPLRLLAWDPAYPPGARVKPDNPR